MKGLEMTLANFVVLIIAIAIIALIVWKVIPLYGSFITYSLKSVKLSLCNNLGLGGVLLGC